MVSVIFAFIYFTFLIQSYIIPNAYNIPIVVFIGYSIIIGLYFFFFILKERDLSKSYQIKFVSEDLFKITLIILMVITYFIPPISFSDVIVDWGEVGFLNYIRSITLLLGCLYIPGSSLYNLFLSKIDIPSKLNVEPFLIKITFYPLLSLSLIGTSTLIFEKLGLQRDYFTYPLFSIILILYFIEYFLRKRSSVSTKFKKILNLNISKSTIVVLFLCLSVIIIGLGFFIVAPYGLREDPHRGIMYAQLVGLKDTPSYGVYCIFWGYISFGLSELSGLPAINVNAILFPLLYLFISSLYIFYKALMNKNIHTRTAIFALLLFVTFSEFSNFIDSETELINITYLFIDTLFMLTFKGIAFFSFSVSITLFTLLFKTQEERDSKFNPKQIDSIHSKNERNAEIILIFAGSWFLIQSFLLYIFPVLIAFIFMIIYSIFSSKKEKNFNFTSYSVVSFILIFTLFDILSNFFYSNTIQGILATFFGNLYPFTYSDNIKTIFFYSFLLILVIIWLGTSKLYVKISKHLFRVSEKKRDYRFIIIVLMIIFIGFFILEIILNLMFTKRRLYLFTYSLHLIFVNLGFLGIMVFLFMPLIFKHEEKLFSILFSWFIIIFLISSVLLVKWIVRPYPYLTMFSDFFIIEYWFSRYSFYSIIPLSILGAILIVNLQKIKFRIKMSKKVKNIFQYLIISTLIIFLVSNNIQSAIDKYNTKQLNDNEAKMIGWISDNIPFKESILVDNSIYYTYVRDFLFNKRARLDLEVDNILNNYEFLTVMNEKDHNCSIMLYEKLGENVNVLEFQDNNNSGKVSSSVAFEQSYQSGWISFDYMTSNSTKNFNINLYAALYAQVAIQLSISSKELRYFNGTNYQKIANIDKNKWYSFKIFFETSDLNNYNLTKYQWKVLINGTDYGVYPFLNSIPNIFLFQISTSNSDYNWSNFLTNFHFSWNVPSIFEYNIIKYPLIIKELRKMNINYFILSEKDSLIKQRIKEDIDIQNELIPHFYNRSIFHQNGITIYSTS